MTKLISVKYCVGPEALEALRRDGMGWGHDLDAGCFRTTAPRSRDGKLTRWFQSHRKV